MNTKLITTFFSPDEGLYIAFLTEHPEISAKGLTHDDAYEQLMIEIDEMKDERINTNQEDSKGD